jgi:hypothetical protein
MMRTDLISGYRLSSLALVALLAGGAIVAGCGSKSNGTGTGGTGGGSGGATAGTTGAGGSAGASGTVGGASGSGAGGSAGAAGSGTGGSAGAAGSGAGGSSTGGAGGIIGVTCEVGTSTQCNDGMDNDGDGKIDLADLECVHPCDNDEATFGTGISGDNMDACKQDCFFDGNSGQGDDGCNWDLRCDPANPGGSAAKSCPYDANKNNCPTMQSAKCIKNCAKLAPNGCDCFGCCAVQTGGMTVNVLLGSGCTADKFGDPAVCARCTMSTTCVNLCEKCEICLGQPAPTDPSCFPTTPDGGAGTGGTGGGAGGSGGTTDGSVPPPVCPANVTTCGPGGQVATDGCMPGFYCQTGCCVSFTID